ncbi:MAG TPA: SDR family oxidoreductase [Candidatus Acidoferrales bacterium]|nr:SDR family oxidoreductase [Candidatus Acidoferrales bacterium]
MNCVQRLAGQTALVTGSSRGIGRAIALRLAREGAQLLLHYHKDRAAVEEVARQVNSTTILQADLRSTDSIDSMLAGLKRSRLDMLINNAGIWKPTPLGSASSEDVAEILDLNLKAVFWVTQKCLPLMRDGARIVNLSSVVAKIGVDSGRSLYGATKAAVEALTRNWALELAPRRILVNAVAPGYVTTDMTREHFSEVDVRSRAISRSPLGRLGNPEEIADAVAFLCSDDARWVTGQTLNVSGGFVV